MKIIGFNKLKIKNKKKRCFILCFTGVFKKCMIIFSVLLFLLVMNLLTKSLFKDVVVSVEQYVESFVNLF